MAELGSLGSAEGMLIRQHNFPDTYDSGRDKLASVDHDRLLGWDYQRAMECFRRHTGTGDVGLGTWARRAWPDKVLAFLVDACGGYVSTDVSWTGFRVLGTVNRSNGYAVWTLELFAKHPQSKTRVYSSESAPNVSPQTCGSFGHAKLGW
jgi:hypothetical protein